MNAQQLKNSVLQDAIEGRLVLQDPNDEPASVLLDRIRKEKAKLVKEGKLKKKDLEETPISEEEIPFEIPESWEWCRVGDIFIHASGKQQSSKNKDVGTLQQYITTSNLYWGKFVLDSLKEMYFTNEELRSCSARKGDLLVCEGGAGYGRSAIWPYDYEICLQNHVHRLRPVIDGTCEYIYYLIYLLKESNRLASVGTAMPGLSANRLKELLVPLPPLAEQKRIVAKIEELLPKVEEYGKAQEALDKLNEDLPKRLKKSILQEAIEGRLVPQDPNDEPASVLLDKIRAEKKRLVKEGKLKKKDLEESPVSREEISFDIPSSWKWCHLGDIGIFERGNGIKRDETFDNGYPCVRYGEMYTKYRLSPTFEKTYSFTTLGVFEKCRKAHKGDLFMALTGENKQDISLAALYVGEDEVAVGGDLCHFTILEAYALYFVYLINSKYFSSKKETLATGDIIVHISTDKLASIAIPLPPLAEQKRIVEKIEQLMHEIDKLKM
jgi:type I restriction enzyme S subunit